MRISLEGTVVELMKFAILPPPGNERRFLAAFFAVNLLGFYLYTGWLVTFMLSGNVWMILFAVIFMPLGVLTCMMLAINLKMIHSMWKTEQAEQL